VNARNGSVEYERTLVLSGLGTVEALNTASIQSQVTGVLEEVDFTEGQTVKTEPEPWFAIPPRHSAHWMKVH
jgi:hypothetical protein